MVTIDYDKGKLEAMISGLKGAVAEFNEQIYQATFDSLLDVRSTAVKPGYAPYKTGTLRRSITSLVNRSKEVIEGAVGTNVVYARIQEFGGKAGRNKGVTIQPKYYISRAVDENKEKIRDRFKQYLAVSRFMGK